MRRNLVFIIISFALATSTLWPILGAGDWYPMHDSTHLLRVELMLETIAGGQFPPIWASGVNEGLGYPLFHFYAPLFHLTTATLAMILGSVLSATKLMLWLTSFLGILGVMIFASRFGRLASIVSAFAYALSPYLALSIYVRGSYSEFLSLAILPWVLLATAKIASPKTAVLASLALSLFILSHNLIPILALPLIAVWIIFHNYHRFIWLLLFASLTLGMTAWFILPLLLERGFTMADQVARVTQYSLHYLEPWQIWNSTWGFGGSALGVEDGMSFKLGKLQIILGLLGLVFALWHKSRALLILGGFLLFYTWLTTSSSSLLWDHLWVLSMVQFPWRALGIVAVLISILGGYFISLIKLPPLKYLFVLVTLIFLGFLNLKYFAPQSIIKPTPLMQDISEIVPEFMPVWLTKDNPVVADSTVLPLAYYPTWEVQLRGERVKTYPSQAGYLAFSNQNNLEYTVTQSKTGLEQLALVISLASTLLALLIYLYFPYAKL